MGIGVWRSGTGTGARAAEAAEALVAVAAVVGVEAVVERAEDLRVAGMGESVDGEKMGEYI